MGTRNSGWLVIKWSGSCPVPELSVSGPEASVREVGRMAAPNVVDRAGGAGELRGEGGGAADGAAQSAVQAAGGSQSGQSRQREF